MTDQTTLAQVFEVSQRTLSFRERPEAIPGDVRISWRLSMLCLLVDRGRGRRLNLQTLHLMWWAIRTPESRSLFLRWMQGSKQPDDLLVRYDPSLSYSLDMALGQGLIVMTSAQVVQLTPAGGALAASVWAEDGVFVEEKEFLRRTPKSISQQAIRRLLEWQ